MNIFVATLSEVSRTTAVPSKANVDTFIVVRAFLAIHFSGTLLHLALAIPADEFAVALVRSIAKSACTHTALAAILNTDVLAFTVSHAKSTIGLQLGTILGSTFVNALSFATDKCALAFPFVVTCSAVSDLGSTGPLEASVIAGRVARTGSAIGQGPVRLRD